MKEICEDCACIEVCEINGSYPVYECEYFKDEPHVLQSIVELQRAEIARLNKLVVELNANISDLILHGTISERREE